MKKPANSIDRVNLFEHKAPRYFSIDAGQAFLNSLARAAFASVNYDPLALAQMEIFLPTRRAMRNLSSAFIQEAEGAASLLPRIQAIGALDDDIAALGTDSGNEHVAFDEGGGDDGLPPAISTMERRLILAHLTARQNEKFAGSQNWIAALGAARELEKILDSFYTEDIPFKALDKISFETLDLANHWEISRDFLKIVTHSWPAYLAEREMMDPTERRIALIHRAADQWEQAPPSHPVIIAGSTGSTPAVARLMEIAARLPQGCVILPGVDLTLDDRAWGKVNDAHPQAGLYALMKKANLERDNIHPFPVKIDSAKANARQMLLSLALRPAETTDDWLQKIENITKDEWRDGIDGVGLIEAVDEEGEAGAIALAIRETVEQAEKTVMLVTPDRDLTRRVISKLERWQIKVDDSAGIPFANSERGTILQLIARWLEDISNPVLLLSVLRHPLCNTHMGDLSREHGLALLDKGLRGLKPAPGLAGIKAKFDNKYLKKSLVALIPLLDWLEAILAPFLEAQEKPEEFSFSHYLKFHIEIAQALTIGISPDGQSPASMGDDGQQSVLWRGEDGIITADIVASLMDCSHLVNTSAGYSDIFSSLISGETVRRHRATHPRVTILGPLEARLQNADHIILGGLTEGVWPGEAMVDGFLSRAMREKVGLPSPERRIGLAAHDFSQLASNEKITLTYALRAGTAPAKPSRWIIRLKNILSASIGLEAIDQSARYAVFRGALNKPLEKTLIEPPKPCPPWEARPRKLSVTRIDKWLRDPYFIYARYILNFRKLDIFNEKFSYRHIGTIVHAAYEKFADARGIEDEAISLEMDQETVRGLLREELHQAAIPYHLREMWQPSLDKSANWFAQWHRLRLTEGRPVILEKKGVCEIETSTTPFTLEATVDRIDVMAQSDAQAGVAIYDYKTGTLPSQKLAKIFSPQLSLTGVIVKKGGFKNLNTDQIRHLAFIKTLNRKSSDVNDQKSDDIFLTPEIVEDAHERLIALLAHFDDPQTPYLSQPRPQFMNDYGDYDHLARRKEWGDAGNDEGDGS